MADAVQELKAQLSELGFNEYESKIILFLFTHEGYADAKQIEKGAKVPLSRIYSIMLDLEEHGLIRKMPGNVNKYASLPKDEFISAVLNKKEKEQKQKHKRLVDTANALKHGLSMIPSSITPDFQISYYTDDKTYWKVYNDAVKKLKAGDRYRIINSRRLADSFLDFELKDNPHLKEMIINDNKMIDKGVIFHLITNPKAIVQHTRNELKDDELVKKAFEKLFSVFSRPNMMKNRFITIAPEFNNLIFVILKEDAFIEFYNESTSSIASAIHIRSENATKDLARWFDGFDKNKKHNPQKDYEIFRRKIMKYL